MKFYGVTVLFCLMFNEINSWDDFRFISKQDLETTTKTFSQKGTSFYSHMLFDISSNQVFVSAKDIIFRLRLGDLGLIESAPWTASENNITQCINKGQSEDLCHNYVQILLKKGKRLFACGTHAFLPQCTWRNLQNISEVTEWISGIARCPYSPLSNHTSLILENGDYFYGGLTDFSGSEALISKSVDESITLTTKLYSPQWLNEPEFVGSFETNQFVYFVFREAAIEYINCGKAIYSRIARVCKNDIGGLMNKKIFSSFIKARLNCSISGEYPFYFNEIQSISYMPDEGLVYASFTTPPNGIGGSAICAFSLSSIQKAFDGPFKTQDGLESAWHAKTLEHKDHLECRISQPSHQLESLYYQLMDQAVQPKTLNPLHVAERERYTHITTDIVATKLHTSVHVLYVATLEGLIKKISILPRTLESCVVEIWETDAGIYNPIKNMNFIKQTNSIYITTKHNLIMIPADHCQRYKSREGCINAMDPYCGWNEGDETCSLAPRGNPLDKYWDHSATACPILDAKVDGGWSAWNNWSPCVHSGSTDSTDTCICRQRFCNNPTPKNGGRECTGMAVTVTNCTVHGGWSDWSAWSSCSSTCGMGIKTRSRTCTNPSPAYGGRVCVGQQVMEADCTDLLPCPMQPKHGGWSEWESWSTCSISCGVGFKKRKRRCNNPKPRDGGDNCNGNDTEYMECVGVNCGEELRKHYTTDWVKVGNSTLGGFYRKRFRVICKARVRQASDLKLLPKEETQYCNNLLECYTDTQKNPKWSSWSPWNECSVLCGGGIQNRTRYCEGRGCQGSAIEIRNCNQNNCHEEWGCWSEWSPCNVSCGWGVRIRVRNCLINECKGSDKEIQPCQNAPCESLLGWEEWSVWSICDENGEQHRKRKCRANNPDPKICQGNAFETRICVINGSLEASINLGMAILYIILGALVGSVATFGGIFGHKYIKNKRMRIPSSPHYINTKQNPYITVPLHDRLKKNTASTSNNVLNNIHNGTLKSVKCYDYDTIKKNSHGLNSHAKQEILNDDKLYYD